MERRKIHHKIDFSKEMTIAVDFDGTIVEHHYPEIGKERPFAVATLKQLIKDGHKLILWTVREGKLLDEAVEWCKSRGITFYAVNQDYDEDEKDKNPYFSRKIKAQMFIDDCNVGGLPDWGTIYQLISRKISYEEYLSEAQYGSPQPPKKKWWKF